jgi:hypothetical protein
MTDDGTAVNQAQQDVQHRVRPDYCSVFNGGNKECENSSGAIRTTSICPQLCQALSASFHLQWNMMSTEDMAADVEGEDPCRCLSGAYSRRLLLAGRVLNLSTPLTSKMRSTEYIDDDWGPLTRQ